MDNGTKKTNNSIKSELAETKKEKDHWCCSGSLNENVNPVCHCSKKGKHLLGRTENETINIIMPLYRSIMRLHFEYCIQLCSPYLEKGIGELEKVQKRAIKIITRLEHLSYEERMKNQGLFGLEKGRVMGT